MKANKFIAMEKGKENIFEDLGFESEEAANLKLRADLILDLQKIFKERGWTQKQAAKFFHETQSKISNLMNGDINQFSTDKLVQMIIKTEI